jgi:hypothetical protein
MPMSGTEGGEGASAPEGFRLQHSEGPGENNGNGRGYGNGNDNGDGGARERAPEPHFEASAPLVSIPPPPPENRPSVVWSSTASAPDPVARGDREE